VSDLLVPRGVVAMAAHCARCHTELGPALLSCPACGALVHTARLQELAARAESLEAEGDLSGALAAWSEARTLLPADSGQHQAVTTRMEGVAGRLERGEGKKAAKKAKGAEGGAKAGIGATILLALAKLKTFLFLALTKAKFLLLGLGKIGTLLSMFGYIAFAWALYGWQLGVGLVVCLYVHEMGHVWELRRYGISASAPMFVPGLGAFVALREHPLTPRIDARIGLAGPMWGLAANLAFYAAWLATGSKLWLAIASVDAMIHMFNMVPVWQLDGSRGFASLSRRQRYVAAGALLALGVGTGSGMTVVAALVAGWRCFTPAPQEEDWRGLATYVVLATAFALMSPGSPLGLAR
jgi:Zn-dependent protease